uniref:Protein PIN-likeS 3 n=1 Tax=Vitis vinifera TaxID=29760 RepID=F6I0B3_VITVI
MPVIRVLLLTALGSFLALDRIDILGDVVRKQLNTVVFFVFNPALVYSNLANTITLDRMVLLWFMPLNILTVCIIGSALGLLLVKTTRAPQHLKGLILGSCAAGNMGNMPLIIIPAVCREKGSPFGAPDVCHTFAMAYASLSMAIGAICLWSYVYNIVRIFSSNAREGINLHCSISEEYPHQFTLPHPLSEENLQVVAISGKMKQLLRKFSRKINLKELLAPSTTGAIVGFIIGMVPHLRKLIIGGTAPLHVVQDSASLLGDAAIPSIILIMGGNLLKGLKGSGIQLSFIVGILAVRFIFLPLLGIIIVKGALRFGLVHPDPLFQFVLLLQYAVPPAINLGTIIQLFGAGESECSVIMLWTYGLASVSLTLWSTLFMWLVS